MKESHIKPGTMIALIWFGAISFMLILSNVECDTTIEEHFQNMRLGVKIDPIHMDSEHPGWRDKIDEYTEVP